MTGPASDLYGKAYEEITTALAKALDDLGQLCDNELEKLIKIVGNDVKIIEDGGGPEDLFGDFVAAVYTIVESPKIKNALKAIGQKSPRIVTDIEQVSKVAKKYARKLQNIESLVTSPMPDPGTLANDA